MTLLQTPSSLRKEDASQSNTKRAVRLAVIHDWQFIAVVILLVLTSFSVFFDIILLRQVLGFATFTLVPGFFLVSILRLGDVGVLKKALLAVALGLSFMMFACLLVNIIYYALGYATPLSKVSLTLSLSSIVLLLFLVAYDRNKGNVFLSNITRVYRGSREITQLLFPVTFPILAAAGTIVMNTSGSNLALMFLYFLMIVYNVVLFVLKPERKFLFPVSILMTAFASILMLSLRTDYVIGYDSYWEYQVSRPTLASLHWIPSSSAGPLSATLTVGLLPTAYSSILGISLEYVTKLIYAFVFSMIPLAVFVMTRGYLGKRFAFAASLLIVFQSTFVFLSQSNPRTAIALFFFAVAIMVLLDSRMEKVKKVSLTILLITSVMISHYTTTFIFLIILTWILVGTLVLPRRIPRHARVVSKTLPVLYFAMMFFWYGQLTGSAFSNAIVAFDVAIRNLGSFFLFESRDEGTLHTMGFGASSAPDLLYSLDLYLVSAIIGIGVLYLAWLMLSKKRSLGEFSEALSPSLVLMMGISSILLVSMIILPHVSSEYTMDRLWTQMLVVLSGAFVVGCFFLSRSKKRRAVVLVTTVLVANFFTAGYLVYQGYGVHKSMIINSDGPEYSYFYIHAGEIAGATWLKAHMNESLTVFTDFDTSARVAVYGDINISWSARNFFSDGSALRNGYLFLGYYELVKGQVYTGVKFNNTANYRGLFESGDRIYDNGYTEIYK